MKNDFLNPMVIKELRQGLKSRIFLGSFLGLQGLMVLSMFIYLSVTNASNGSGDMEVADAFFWSMLALTLLVSIPYRSFQALHDEVKGNTLEMLFLTRMNSWNIAFGKWCALVLQIFLLVSAVFPYLVLRYFLGSIDIIGNILILLAMVLASMLLSAVGVGLSAWTSKIMRGLVMLGALIFGFQMVAGFFAMYAFSGGGFSSGPELAEWVLILLVIGVVMVFCVEYGASQIAPPAENHAVRKRLLALVLSLVLVGYAVFIDEGAEPVFVCMMMLIPVAVDALCEPLIGIRSIYLKMKRFRFIRWFFFPGWASGWLFVTVLYFALLFTALGLDSDEEIFTFGMIAYNTLIFPFVLMRLIPPLTRKPLLAYCALHGLCLAFCLFIAFLEEMKLIGDYFVISHLFPMLGFFQAGQWRGPDMIPVLLIFVMLGLNTVVLVNALRPFRQMNYLSREGAD